MSFDQIIDTILLPFKTMAASTLYRLLTILLGVTLSFLFYFILDLIANQIIILEARLRGATNQIGQAFGVGKKRGRIGSIKSGNVVIPHPLFVRNVDQDDIYGLSNYAWPLIYIGTCAVFIALANLDPAADPFINSLYAFVVGLGVVYGVQFFLRYIRRIQTIKYLMDTLDLLVNEITVQRNSLNLAITQIKIDYRRHYERFGEKSWYYKNPVLSRLVYLASMETSIVPLDVLRRLAKDLGEIDILSGIVIDVEPKITAMGDAGAAFRESILDFREEYVAQQSERIPQYSDKLFIPIMITHFLPLLIIILWPVMDTIYNMLSGNTFSNPIVK